VTLAIISSAGITPLLTMMMTRGNSVCGNSADGMCSAAYPPAAQSAKTMNVIETEWRRANRGSKDRM
jgi:hypothetical protein